MTSRLKMSEENRERLSKLRGLSQKSQELLATHTRQLGVLDRADAHVLLLAMRKNLLTALNYIKANEAHPTQYFSEGAADVIMHHENQTKAQDKPTITYGRSKGR